MFVDYNGQRPMTLTLKSGISWYIYPKQKNIQIEEQDFFLTPKLGRLRKSHPNIFSNLRYDEDLKEKIEPSNKKICKKSDFDFTDEKFKPNPNTTGTDISVMGSLANGEKTLMGKGERTRKVIKKHVKVVDYQEKVRVNPTVKN